MNVLLERRGKREKPREGSASAASSSGSGERDKAGRLRRERHRVRRLVEAGVPAVEVAGELVVEDVNADLEQGVVAVR